MITDLGHTALRVRDLEQALAFYARLGIHEAFRLHDDDGSLLLVYVHVGGDRFLELFPGDAPRAGASRGEARGEAQGAPQRETSEGSFMHLCLLCDDLLPLVERLRAEGVAIEREVTTGLDGNLQAWVRDPDGNAIELMQLVEDSPQRRVARGG